MEFFIELLPQSFSLEEGQFWKLGQFAGKVKLKQVAP